MAGPTDSSRKRKTFPDLGAPTPKPAPIKSDVESEEEASDGDSDVPEAVTLTGGRAAEEAKANALKAHQDRLKEKKKAQNKSREAFIQSTKSKSSPGALIEPETKGSQREGEDEEESSEEGENGDEGEGGDPVLLARMDKAMQEAQEEDEEETSDEDEGPTFGNTPSSARLPDSVFAAAAAAHQAPERKRKPTVQKRDEKAKRRRVREGPSERVVGGRTLRVTTSLDAPPPLPSISTRKANNSVKGGNAFRRKWKKRDASQAQIRSRSGPARNFVTAVQ
ncbi:hypothetical protein BDV93DRAFT_525053 [Ceratobasidium sp. AG-I]|nr:hypothetical protein BDV93DRAFT_525053 [Ceratobasidium sp. AG-I]